MLIGEISPSTPAKFSLNPFDKKSDQLKTNQPLPLTASQEQNPTKKEAILLAKIKQLEKQLKQTTTERDNLKTEKQKAEALVQAEKQRANNYHHQLKVIVKSLYQ